MYDYQYMIMLVLVLYWLKASSKGAFILLCGYLVYTALIIYDISAEEYAYYYGCASLLSFLVGYFLQKENLYAAMCSYSLIFINLYGLYLWYWYLPPTTYDNICSIITIIQVLLITPKGLLNGYRYRNKHNDDKSSGFDSAKTCVKMFKNSQKET